MNSLKFDITPGQTFLPAEELKHESSLAGNLCRSIISDPEEDKGVKGWLCTDCSKPVMDIMRSKAEEIRREADVFVLVGVGGSNQAARAVIKALQKNKKPRIVYAGNSLSAHYLLEVLEEIEGKSIYVNVIAKNFETLEPGSHFRVLRKIMEKSCSSDEMTRRVILTGTYGSRLEEISKENGYLFLPFPEEIGGRYSAFSPVGLFPMMVAGIDTDLLLNGVKQMRDEILSSPEDNISVKYAAYRSLAYKKGYNTELLAAFEPQFEYFIKWWIQLFGESEGKDGKGIFPAGVIYSEDLHSMGQYLQEGRRNLLETFIKVKDPQASVNVPRDREFKDGFDYLEGMDFADINRAAEQATIDAHTRGGVPCATIEIPRIEEEVFGRLFYFFMMTCAVSGKLQGSNPFNQEGVEEYKRSMFKALGK